MIREQEIKFYNELRDLFETQCYVDQRLFTSRRKIVPNSEDEGKFIGVVRSGYSESDAFIHCGGKNTYVYSVRPKNWFMRPAGKRRWVTYSEGARTDISEEILDHLLMANRLTLAGYRVILPLVRHLIPDLKNYYLRQIGNNVYLLYKNKDVWVFQILIIKVFIMKRYIVTVDELFNLGYY